MTPLIIDIAERREVGQTARTRQIASSKGSTSAEKRETGQSTRTGQRTSSKSNFLALSAAFNQLLLSFMLRSINYCLRSINYCSHRLTPQCFTFTSIIVSQWCLLFCRDFTRLRVVRVSAMSRKRVSCNN